MTAQLACPDQTTWRGFVLGDVADAVASELEAHLRTCEVCRSTIGGLTAAEDEFVRVLRGHSPVLASVDARVIDQFLRRLPSVTDETLPRIGDRETVSGHVLPGLDFLDEPHSPDELGRLAGFRILKLLGTGGMGAVFLAEDPHLRRQVAIKILLEHRFSQPQCQARFLREAQTLARLRHPQIVQILGAGHHRGRPYLVLEYVNGGTLASQINGVPQASAVTATLIASLARALQYAHELGVAHRDIKPSNILMQAIDGVGDGSLGIENCLPKVSDFGLAAEAGSDSLTQSSDLLGTPSYMAPEMTYNARAAAPELADVYSLGAVLYELLTGVTPFRGASPLDTVSQVREMEPVAPRRLRLSIPRDLETICMKCLEKTPSRRYGSAQLLADELERFLAGAPIKARPLGTVGRIWKWSRRRPATATLAVAVVGLSLAVILGTAGYQWQLRAALARATSGEAIAKQQSEIASSQYLAARKALRNLLARDKAKDSAAVPAVLELQLGQYQDALSYFESVLQGQAAPDAGIRLDAAEAGIEISTRQLMLGQTAAAETNLKRALDRLQELVREFPDSQLYLDRLASGLNNWAMMQEDAAEGERLLKESLEIRKRLVQWNPVKVEYQNGLAESLHNLGSHYQQRHYNSAEVTGYYDASLEIRRRIAAERPNNSAYAAQAADTLINLGLFQSLTDAEASYEEAARLLAEAARLAPQDRQHRDSLAAVYVNWAFRLQDSAPRRAAEKSTLAIAELDAILRDEPNYVSSRRRLTPAYGNRAQALGKLGEWENAVADWDHVVETSDAKDLLLHRALCAEALVKSGRHQRAAAEAEELLPQAQGKVEYLSHWAVIFSLAAAQALDDSAITSEDRAKLADDYAARAITALNELEGLGGLQDTIRRRELQQDPTYDALRNHEAFQDLLRRINTPP